MSNDRHVPAGSPQGGQFARKCAEATESQYTDADREEVKKIAEERGIKKNSVIASGYKPHNPGVIKTLYSRQYSRDEDGEIVCSKIERSNAAEYIQKTSDLISPSRFEEATANEAAMKKYIEEIEERSIAVADYLNEQYPGRNYHGDKGFVTWRFNRKQKTMSTPKGGVRDVKKAAEEAFEKAKAEREAEYKEEMRKDYGRLLGRKEKDGKTYGVFLLSNGKEYEMELNEAGRPKQFLSGNLRKWQKDALDRAYEKVDKYHGKNINSAKVDSVTRYALMSAWGKFNASREADAFKAALAEDTSAQEALGIRVYKTEDYLRYFGNMSYEDEEKVKLSCGKYIMTTGNEDGRTAICGDGAFLYDYSYSETYWYAKEYGKQIVHMVCRKPCVDGEFAFNLDEDNENGGYWLTIARILKYNKAARHGNYEDCETVVSHILDGYRR